ncbi:MAG: PaaI family thioesterase [Bacteroidales bacterium]|nr:PaaI family thioesterase [Bacteroidales bacterium]
MTLKETLNTCDKFASSNGMQLIEVSEGKAKAQMLVQDNHLNAGGVCQGGALFTLGDLAVAAAVNSHGQLTFGIQNSISFLQSAKKGDTLTATASETYNHPKIPYVNVEIRNQDDKLIAVMTGQGYRKKDSMPYDGLQ